MSNSSANLAQIAVAGAAVFGLGLFAGYLVGNHGERRRKSEDEAEAPPEKSSSEKSKLRRDPSDSSVAYPPFPPELVQLLESTSLCYLSTSGLGDSPEAAGDPHLSLMLFTYYNDEEDREVIIMTTRRDTKKLQNILANPKAAILLHDFPAAKGDFEDTGSPNGGRKYSRTSSITVYGKMRVLDNGSMTEQKYRNIHSKSNPKYQQFIVGENIAVLLVVVESARICNVDDKVTMWSVKEIEQS
mmetsp:Transcript_60386/g.107576  ORF Transcript_60386/g.107576 Transcript_60386/m.107576 type:complete len:243 (-) Transcript_60386:76-804(-)